MMNEPTTTILLSLDPNIFLRLGLKMNACLNIFSVHTFKSSNNFINVLVQKSSSRMWIRSARVQGATWRIRHRWICDPETMSRRRHRCCRCHPFWGDTWRSRVRGAKCCERGWRSANCFRRWTWLCWRQEHNRLILRGINNCSAVIGILIMYSQPTQAPFSDPGYKLYYGSFVR